ncbi:MAG TPA: hypothetical protein VMB75_02445, partial [Rhodocyclaceae bacterium]|nr:hypothetical protein [Rhodocyclaceae bacterium]
MKQAEDAAAIVRTWLDRLEAPGAAIQAVAPPPSPAAALAALAAEALARGRTLLVVTPGDELLADISNALDLGLRPLCLVLPAADYACRIALRATLSLLKSRLARAGADSEGSAWTSQRRRLADEAELWRDCLAWSGRGLDSESWPQGLERLYPVRILPAALAGQLAGTPEWVVLTQPGSRPQPWPGAQRTLCFGGATGAGDLAATDETARLRGELDLLTQELADLELELATAQAEVADFAHRYHRLVGGPMAELDSLRAEIA